MARSLTVCAACTLLVSATLFAVAGAISEPLMAPVLETAPEVPEEVRAVPGPAPAPETAREVLLEMSAAPGPAPAPEQGLSPSELALVEALFLPVEAWVWAGCPLDLRDDEVCDCHCGVVDLDCFREDVEIPEDCLCAPEVEAMAESPGQFCEVSLALTYSNAMSVAGVVCIEIGLVNSM